MHDISPKRTQGAVPYQLPCQLALAGASPITPNKPSFRCRRKTGGPGQTPMETSLDWKPKCMYSTGTGD